MALQVIFCSKLLTVPEQVDAQGQLLERRTQAGVIVPALLHDLVDLKDKAGRERLVSARTKRNLSSNITVLHWTL